MSLTDNSRNEALNAIVVDSMSLHSGFPGLTGAGELSGGGYGRKKCSFGPAAGGTRSLTDGVKFTVGSNSVVRWAGLWAGIVFKGYSPNGGAPKEFAVRSEDSSFLCWSHGYSLNTPVVFYGGDVPKGLVEGKVYYVYGPTDNYFAVAATANGPRVGVYSEGSNDCVVSVISEDAYSSASTHTINNWSIGAVF